MSRLLALLVLVGAALATSVTPAAAACHIAAFVEDAVSVQETAGSVTLTVFLQGRQPSCEGTVDFTTEDGSATAGDDYTATQGTLRFVAGDDREETIEVAILGDDVDEGEEQFTVALSNPTGGISGTSTPATVAIADPSGDATGGDTTATDAPGGGTATPVEEDTIGEPQSDATTPVDPGVAAEVEESGPGFVVLLVIVFVVVIVVAVIATRRRED